MIRNTEKAAKDPAEAMLILAASMGPGGSDQAIAEQERAGQAQLVNSEQLPTDLNGDDQAAFEALGITFGEPTPGDPLFQSATLPEGWKREAADHDMWSYVVDRLGRRRVAVFYKAAFYDRRAFMRINTLFGYVTECVRQGTDIVTDDAWATPAAVAGELRKAAQRAQEKLDRWSDIAETKGTDDELREFIAEDTTTRDRCIELATSFEAVTEA
ncbi:hypothetical protein [Streptomyces sp. NBC_00996]|uniref:hypothetical protein n=1 Tax=Streptomyces sp. NBC_00996 TaxID=2903710 RepID=UPI003866D54B|nr:hypothetical protein OG390_17390 [Streptomyces sp. NBC_00996]